MRHSTVVAEIRSGVGLRRQGGVGRGLLRTARPGHWVKNGLVFAAPFAGGALRHGAAIRQSLLAAVAFCLAASGTYLINDATDAERDRLHPTKRFRPIAAGEVPAGLARIVAVMLLVLAIGVASVVSAPTAGIIGTYIALTLSYSLWLKHIAVVDVVAVASGFLLRAIGGAVATHVPASGPFLALASFGALFVVVGKREGERIALGDGAAAHRASLASYSTAFTAQLLSLALTATVLSYASWAFNIDADEPGIPWLALSVIPFVIAMLRATQLVLLGGGAEPEELILRDRGIQLAAVSTGVLLALGLYVV